MLVWGLVGAAHPVLDERTTRMSPSPTTQFRLRPYQPADETSWLRCRVLSFLGSQYFDDVRTSRTVLQDPSIALVAVIGTPPEETVVGILDVEISGAAATIETLAVHPDHQQSGIATALLQAGLARLRDQGVETLDAWTREDGAANSWYRRNGFTEKYRYLHVYLSWWEEPGEGFATPEGLSLPVMAFMHASIDQEARMRSQYRRTYICRQYLRPVLA